MPLWLLVYLAAAAAGGKDKREDVASVAQLQATARCTRDTLASQRKQSHLRGVVARGGEVESPTL